MSRDATGPETSSETEGASFIIGGGETGALVRAMDWRTSRLGRASEWPQSLRTSLNICLSSRFPIALYWGPEFVMLYNDDLRPMVGANKHPQAMGRPAFEVLPEIRGLIEPLLERVVETGEAIWSEDLMLPLLRSEMQEESYFTFTYSPIRDESGAVGGVFCAVIETTDKIIEGRRLRLLNALADATLAKTRADACALIATQIARAPADVPFALFYLLDDAASTATLAGAANIDPNDACAPASIVIGDDSIWPLAAVCSSGAPRELGFDGVRNGARGAIVLPFYQAGGARPQGFIVAGLSPMLRSADSYARFHNLLTASVAQGVGNAAAYEAERRRAESLAALDRAKTAFFSNISHEFRTPLTLMLAPIQDMLATPAGTSIDHPTVDLLHRNAQRLLKLVNTLLEFSRIEAGRIDAVYEPVDLSALTVDLASSFRAVVERAGLALIVECPPLPWPVHVDRDMWEKIVLNLLSNAFKFTFEGSITVRLGASDETVRLEVADTGTGIAAQDLPRLFERFRRIEGARARSHEGSGIGLALIHELVRLHGGEVHATSTIGVGTVFTACIPRGAGRPAAERLHESRARPTPGVAAGPYVSEALRWDVSAGDTIGASEFATPVTGSRQRIVFADDNADMRDYVARLLGERWEVETASDGAAALAVIKQRPPALVLCDVMMPGLDGFALVQALRADATLRTIPIILLSARAGEEETARGLGSGANDYIAKPFSARELLVRVASALATARTAREMLERERVQRDNLYRHFMQAPFPVCVFRGPAHVIELANPQILRAWGMTSEIVGRPLLQAIPQLHDQPFIGYLDEVFRTGVPYEGRAEMARLPLGPQGELEEVYFNFVYAPLHDPDGAVEGVLVSAFAVTDIVIARRDSDQARRAAEAAAQVQRDVREFQERFVAVLGHDLRNPLAAIAMGTGLLRHQSLTPAAQRTLDRITSSTRRMSRMVAQILDLSRARIGGGIVITPAPMDLYATLNAIIDEVRVAHPTRTFEVRGSSMSGTWDRDRLEQVFSNLVSNAIHHGIAASEITIVASQDGDHVHVSVHNEGPPIADAIRATLFDPFRRGNDVTSASRSSGLGLGLFISRELVTAHGGEIHLVSTATEGTMFRVSLPRTAPNMQPKERAP